MNCNAAASSSTCRVTVVIAPIYLHEPLEGVHTIQSAAHTHSCRSGSHRYKVSWPQCKGACTHVDVAVLISRSGINTRVAYQSLWYPATFAVEPGLKPFVNKRKTYYPMQDKSSVWRYTLFYSMSARALLVHWWSYQNHTLIMDSVCWRHLQTLDILVDGPQADLIREEATALRAESGLVPGHEGAQVASAAKQSE